MCVWFCTLICVSLCVWLYVFVFLFFVCMLVLFCVSGWAVSLCVWLGGFSVCLVGRFLCVSGWAVSLCVWLGGFSVCLVGRFLCVSGWPVSLCVWLCVLRQVPWNPDVDACWHSLLCGVSDECEPEWCDSEDPLFILYTSGSTGKPKVHTHTHINAYMQSYTQALRPTH